MPGLLSLVEIERTVPDDGNGPILVLFVQKEPRILELFGGFREGRRETKTILIPERLARRQHARSWELRAAMSLGRLWTR